MNSILSPKELDFIHNNECCRFATTSDSYPHVVPVCYIYLAGIFYISTDYNTKKYKNILKNAHVSLVIDIYNPGSHNGLFILGNASIIDKGPLYRRLYSLYYSKFEWIKKDPWEGDDSPFIEVMPISKTSWGL